MTQAFNHSKTLLDEGERSLLRRKIKNYRNQRRVVEFLKEFAVSRRPALTLEVGCGDGYFSEIISEFGGKVIATDIEKKIAGSVVGKNNVSFQLADGTDLPFKSKMFDLVLSVDVVEHVEDDQCFVSENLRVLKRGGALIVVTPNKRRLANRISALLGKPRYFPLCLGQDYLGKSVIHSREYTKRELSSIVGKSRFKTAKHQIIGCYFGLSGNFGFADCPRILENYCGSWFLMAERR